MYDSKRIYFILPIQETGCSMEGSGRGCRGESYITSGLFIICVVNSDLKSDIFILLMECFFRYKRKIPNEFIRALDLGEISL